MLASLTPETPHTSCSECSQCSRLRNHCVQIAATRRAAYRSQTYWGKPVSGFGDPQAELVIVGLAPSAHGANRTGRMLTGDRSGDWLYRALFELGYANQPTSTHRDDGLVLRNCYVTCVVKCAPPDNKPTPGEFGACRPYLAAELQTLRSAKTYLALGNLAYTELWKELVPAASSRKERVPRPAFRHGLQIRLPDRNQTLLLSYHPSQQNTFTGRLTWKMWMDVLSQAQHPSDNSHYSH
jgi:uracil-DNA glycosylase family 4